LTDVFRPSNINVFDFSQSTFSFNTNIAQGRYRILECFAQQKLVYFPACLWYL